jgi:hypothetical protein
MFLFLLLFLLFLLLVVVVVVVVVVSFICSYSSYLHLGSCDCAPPGHHSASSQVDEGSRAVPQRPPGPRHTAQPLLRNHYRLLCMRDLILLTYFICVVIVIALANI